MRTRTGPTAWGKHDLRLHARYEKKAFHDYKLFKRLPLNEAHMIYHHKQEATQIAYTKPPYKNEGEAGNEWIASVSLTNQEPQSRSVHLLM